MSKSINTYIEDKQASIGTHLTEQDIIYIFFVRQSNGLAGHV